MALPLCRRLPLVAVLLLSCGAASSDDPLGEVGDFALTERSGRTVRKDDLRGKIWIASFVFTRCTGECPQISATIRQLQNDLRAHRDVLFVTFTVDPEHDDPQELNRYAEHFGADPDRWLFLTGKQDEIYHLIHESFHLYAKQRQGAERKPGAEVEHQQKLVLVDQKGYIRGYYDGMRDSRAEEPEAEYQANLRKLKAQVASLEHDAWYLPRDFPRFNATLNAFTAALLVLGYTAIRRRLIKLHIACMVFALVLSAIFLCSYGYHHAIIKQGISTSFSEQTSHAHPPPWVGMVYQFVLWTHIPLAALIVPLALVTALQGIRRRWSRHVRLARWTLPIWLYVAVTGVLVYWMLYRLYPPP